MKSHAQHTALPYPDQRLHPRLDMAASARLLGHDAIPRPVRILDISLNGLGLQFSDAMEAGDTCAIAFDADIHGETRRINVWSRVIYCVPHVHGGFQIGVQFRDYDSLSKMLIEQLCNPDSMPAGW